MDGEKEYIKAGRIARKILDVAEKKCDPGVNLESFADELEALIKSEGGLPAFPVNVSLNEVAAHQIPHLNDSLVFSESDVVKVDVGVHIDGYIADCAVTIDLSGEHGKLLDASAQALENALSVLEAGIDVSEIGKEIQSTIKSFGFNPVQNLGGHSLDKFEVHAGLNIPNINTNEGSFVYADTAVAIEPFSCTGSGFVGEGAGAEIFELVEVIPVRARGGREIVAEMVKFQGLPFAERWLAKKFSKIQLNLTLRELLTKKALRAYPPLKEKKGVFVAQAETSVLVFEDDIKVLV